MTPARGTWVREARTPPRITASAPGITNPTKSAVSAAARKKTVPTAHGPGIEKNRETNRSSTDVGAVRRLPATEGGTTSLDETLDAQAFFVGRSAAKTGVGGRGGVLEVVHGKRLQESCFQRPT